MRKYYLMMLFCCFTVPDFSRKNYNISMPGGVMTAIAAAREGKTCEGDLAAGGAKDFSASYGYYMLQARAKAGNKPGTFKNPVIPGFNPDPSICRVGNDYYVTTSSFEYFPAIPLYHSQDLINWEHIGNILDRPEQIDLEPSNPSDGVFSPVIRYHDGMYYTSFTLLKYDPEQHITNWLVTASSPTGPWSDPVCITDDPLWRIDTNLFFDDDGKCYFTANSYVPGDTTKLRRRILIQELDLKTKKLVGDWHEIGRGNSENSMVAEGAHIYKLNGFYYLMIAENVAPTGHSESISRSKSIFGQYEQCPHNVIVTTSTEVSQDERKSGQALYNVGHGDLVETPQGEWWMVILTCRRADVLGRETTLVPVEWNADGWPVVNPGVSRVLPEERLPKGSKGLKENPVFRDDWDSPKLKPCWMFLRVPQKEFWSFSTKPGYLQIPLLPTTAVHPANTGCPAFISRRIQNHNFDIISKLDFEPLTKNEEAGLLLRRGSVTMGLLKGLDDSGNVIRIVSHRNDERKVLAENKSLEKGEIFLKISCRNETELSFFYSLNGGNWIAVGKGNDGTVLGGSAPGGHWTGTTAGVYASANGDESGNVASFDFFEMEKLEPANK
ncbi:MAG: glycoside hydrolase family 43 protein [Tannerella sp.]|nr:glycoside hydrolase family 43 protein [Tannerella sp.]